MPTVSSIPEPSSIADWSTVEDLQRRMIEAVKAMEQKAADVGLARHVLEYDSTRRRQALARAMAAPLSGGESAAKAEATAAASDVYAAEIRQLSKEHTAAEQTVAEFEVLKVAWSTAQSLLSMQRESIKRL